MKKTIKILITGAAGQVAYAFLFQLIAARIFPDDVLLDFHLLDLPAKQTVLYGIKMELEDCAFPQLHNVLCFDDVNAAAHDVNWAILIGAAPRQAGMERADLLRINAAIFREQGYALSSYAAADIKVLVVGNPCNTNCLIAQRHAPNIPSDRFYAMMKLDENRARSQLAQKAQVLVKDIENLIIWGNHSSTQYPDFYNASIAGKAVVSILDEHWLQNEFLTAVRQRGAAIINARGMSSGASAAYGIITSLRCLLTDTLLGQYYSIACCSRGEYGIDEGLIFSYPCRTIHGKVMVVPDFKHNTFAEAQLETTLKELRQEMQQVKDLGFL